jgi:hypothetical protein
MAAGATAIAWYRLYSILLTPRLVNGVTLCNSVLPSLAPYRFDILASISPIRRPRPAVDSPSRPGITRGIIVLYVLAIMINIRRENASMLTLECVITHLSQMDIRTDNHNF